MVLSARTLRRAWRHPVLTSEDAVRRVTPGYASDTAASVAIAHVFNDARGGFQVVVGTNTLSNNADQRSPMSATVRDVRKHGHSERR
jgi:hypothetical protein